MTVERSIGLGELPSLPARRAQEPGSCSLVRPISRSGRSWGVCLPRRLRGVCASSTHFLEVGATCSGMCAGHSNPTASIAFLFLVLDRSQMLHVGSPPHSWQPEGSKCIFWYSSVGPSVALLLGLVSTLPFFSRTLSALAAFAAIVVKLFAAGKQAGCASSIASSSLGYKPACNSGRFDCTVCVWRSFLVMVLDCCSGCCKPACCSAGHAQVRVRCSLSALGLCLAITGPCMTP